MPHNFNDDEDIEHWKPFYQLYRQLAEKANEIFELVMLLKDSFENVEDDDLHPVHLMRHNIVTVSAKLASAKAAHDVFHHLMEKAVLIKVNMEELKVQIFAAREFYNGDKEHLSVVRAAYDDFKKIFIQWRRTFDPAQDLPDDWQIFNDPADFPKDDESFDPNEFLSGWDEDDG